MSARFDDDVAEMDPVAETIEALQAVMFRNTSKGDQFEVTVIDTGSEPKAIACEVKITGDTKDDRIKLEKPYLKKGWTCTTDSSDDRKTTCTSPPPPPPK